MPAAPYQVGEDSRSATAAWKIRRRNPEKATGHMVSAYCADCHQLTQVDAGTFERNLMALCPRCAGLAGRRGTGVG